MRERVLTVRQPFADLIMSGLKTVENRSWPVPQTVAPTEDWYLRLWECSYYRSYHLPTGDVRKGTCSFGCYDEPACITGGPLPFPFRLWIHAGAGWADGWTWTRDGEERLAAVGLDPRRIVHPGSGMVAPWVPSSRLGVLLGHVTVTGCHHADECIQSMSPDDLDDSYQHGPWLGEDQGVRYCTRWSDHESWHWQLDDPVLLDKPVRMRGQLSLWRLPPAVTAWPT